jgi:hypothetical protein
LHAFSPVPFVGAQASDGVYDAAARCEQAFAERSIGRSERDGIERRAVGAANSQADMFLADDVGEFDLNVGQQDKRFGIARAKRPGLRKLLYQRNRGAGRRHDCIDRNFACGGKLQARFGKFFSKAYERLASLGDRLTARLAGRLEGAGIGARVMNVGSLFQVFRSEGSGSAGAAFAAGAGAGAAFAPGAGQPSELYLGLLLAGFAVAPRGMGAIPTVASEQDVDDLADAIARVLGAIDRVPATAGRPG